MQVDPTLMNVADGGTVKREICAPTKTSASMVGNPPQTLPPEFRGDVTLSQQNKTAQAKDCKTMKACLDSSNCNNSPDLSPSQQLNNAAASGPAVAASEKRADKRTELPKLKSEGAGVFPSPQWSSGTKVEPLKPCHGNVASNKQSHPQTQPVQSVPSGFQCSAVFKPVQPVAFLPSANFSSSLCKISLPPALGDIAASLNAAANQCQKDLQPQSSGVRGAPLMRTYPYPFSVGRTAEKKTGVSTKLKSNHSSAKNGKSADQHKPLASVVASPAIALPLQHPTLTSAAPTCYTLSPTAAICCGSALASITSQNRLLNHAEKATSTEKTPVSPFKAPPSAAEDHKVGPVELRDVPLDLSAKSKRPKCVNEPAVNNESNQRDFPNSKRTIAYSSAGQYSVLPNTHRNGSPKPVIRPQNHQVSDPKATWGKGSSQEPIKSIPGTYVGVASPILASTLRGKDGKGTFADEFQSFAKQEFISIIDQGEHLASGGKKPSCLMKGSQHAHSNKHVKNTSLSKNCPSKGANTPIQKSGPGRAAHVNPAWQQLSHLPHQAGKNTQACLNNKCITATEGPKLAHHGPPKPEDDKWDRVKSPLSNLASIVKQQAMETSELNAQSSPSTPKDEVLNPLTGIQDAQSKQTSTFKCPPYWSADKWGGAPPQGDSSQSTKRQEKADHAELSGNNADLSAVQRERVGLQAKQCSSKPTGHSHLFASNASTNGNRKESKLAQVLEGDVLKKESGASHSPPTDKLEGMVASILTGQCAGGSDRFEKQTSSTKDEPPSKARAAAATAAAVKQKKSTSKPAKEKSPMGSLKKAAAKKNDTEKTPIKGSCQKEQKKQNTSAAEQRRCVGHESSPGDRGGPIKMEQNHRRADDGRRQRTAEAPAFHSCSAVGETETSDSSLPRLRRGRRRADEARLDLWGFATPSPPPPPVPTPPSSPPPALTSAQPARRPRGRPRSTPLPERASRRTASEAETPTHLKRQRCRSKKYQTGEYITDKVKLEDAEHLEESDPLRQHSETPAERQTSQCHSPAAPCTDPPPRRPSFTRSGSVRYHDSEVSPESTDKPSGKRKFKSKHLCDNGDQKTSKRSSLGKRGASVALEDDSDVKRASSPPPAPKSLPSSPSGKKGSSGRSGNTESPPKKPIPPEVRRLIVNKNAGETLLQRAARLGYQDVVLYCLEKDVSEVNRRDNAGYTALHEASSRGWTQIVQMLLKHGADVNCSAQDGTRPLHDAVASDNLPIVWLLLNHGADPTLATYSGQTPVKLAQSPTMKTFLTEYFTDLEGRKEQDPSLHWDFYSSSLFETDQEACWDFLLSDESQEMEENDRGKTEDTDKDCLVFEFSSEPLLPCYHVQVSLTQGFCNWFLLTDVLKRLKMSARIFRARYPHLEVVSLLRTELWEQVSVSQVSTALASPHKGKKEEEEEQEEEEEDEEEEELVELVRCVPELQRLLGSSIHILQEEEEEEEEKEEEEEEEEEEEKDTQRNAGRACSR